MAHEIHHRTHFRAKMLSFSQHYTYIFLKFSLLLT